MEGALFDAALAVADAENLDLNPEAITLSAHGATLTAEYRGLYAYAMRQVSAPGVSEFSGSFPAGKLRRIGSLFRRSEKLSIRFIEEDNRLVLREGNRRSTVQAVPIREDAPPREIDVVAFASTDALATEVSIASHAVADGYIAPVLTGVRMIARDGRLGVQSCNAMSAIFESSIDASTLGTLEIIVPLKDLQTGLKIMKGSERLGIAYAGRGRFALVGDGAVFIGSLLMGNWPNMNRHRWKSGNRIDLNTSTLREVVQAAGAFSDARNIEFLPDEYGTTILVRSDEGSYSTAVDGVLSREHRMSIADAGIAMRIGDTLTMGLRDDGSAIFTAGHRTLYTLNRVAVTAPSPA